MFFMKKRVLLRWTLCVVLTLVLAISLLATAALADTDGGWEYEVVDGKATVIGYNGNATTLTIPSTLGGYPVTGIGEWAFSSHQELISVTIPSSVTSISEGAFFDCTRLNRVNISDIAAWCEIEFTDNPLYNEVSKLYLNGAELSGTLSIPSGVSRIGNGAFFNCSDLTRVTIPDSVILIGDYAFYNCSGLTKVTIPDGVRSIGSCAFYNCSSLTNMTIPDSMTNIGGSAFSECSSLSSVVIPDSVTNIGDSAFSECSGLTSLTISNSVTIIRKYTFYGCSGLVSVTIPDSVESIGERAFYVCSGLTSITIPSSVRSIGNNAFDNCSSLTSVTIPDSVTSIGAGAFFYCSELTSAKIGSGVTSIENSVFYDCFHLKSVTIGSGVTSIGEDAFRSCSSLTSITIPNGVTSIGKSAFSDCTSMTWVTIPSSVRSIGNSAFEGCSSLTAAAIPEGFTDVLTKTFSGCSAMTDVVLPKSLVFVAPNTFSGCSSLASIHYPGTAADWAEVEIGSGNDALSRASLCGVLSVRYTSKTVNTGKTFRFTPVNNIGDCTWRTGNEAIATVAADGTVTGVTVGNTYLYCTDSTGAETKCLLKIVLGPLSIGVSEKSIRVGESFRFTATGGTGTYTWRTGNTAVAKVDSTGKVTGVSEGNTYLYCRDSAGNEVKCLLKVLSPNLSIHQTEKSLAVGESFQFTATGGSGTYTWRTGNTAVVKVDSTGKVTGVSAGNTYLYCTDSAGEEVSCRLTILAPLSIRYSSKTVTAGGSFQFAATGGSGDYTWRVGNTATATVNASGKVTGVAAGQNTYLYCTDSAGREVKCLLKIVSPPSFCFELRVGESFRFGAAEGSGGYSWRVGNTSIATVDANGNVTGVSAGNTYLYCKDSSGVEIKCLLKIKA